VVLVEELAVVRGERRRRRIAGGLGIFGECRGWNDASASSGAERPDVKLLHSCLQYS
jgi:hypothetical protein